MSIVKMIALPGKKANVVGSIVVKVHEEVKKDQVLINIESGKGNRPIKAPKDGVVEKILVQQGDEVVAGQDLIQLKEEESTVEETSSNDVKVEEKFAQVLILGAGPGGYVAAINAAMQGKQVILVEGNHLGGTCLNVGCIPTKTLVTSSEAYETIKEASTLGIDVENVSVGFDRVKKRKDEVVQTLRDGISYLMKKHEVEVISGMACFKDDQTILAKGNDVNYKITYDDLIIATGSKVANLPIPGADLDVVYNSTTLLENTKLPESLTVIGGGVIGMEFACIYASFGVKVTVIEYLDHLLGNTDLETSKEFEKIIQAKGIQVHTCSKVESIEKTDDGLALVNYSKDGVMHHHTSNMVLMAIGRRPNIEPLALENTSIKVERGAIVVDETMKTNVDHIYAIGDVTNIIQLAHVASHQGIVAVDQILGKDAKMAYNAVPSVIFTSPEIASVGSMGDGSKIYQTSKFYYRSNGKALAMNKTDGYIKLVKNTQTNKIVGATIMGVDASTLINPITLAINQGCSEVELMHTIFPHPTTGEIIHEAAMGLNIGFIHQ